MNALSLARFAELVNAYGADLSRFPEGERDEARALLRDSVEARALVEAEVGLDARFANVDVPELSPTLARRLLEVPLRVPERRTLWPFATRTRWIPALSWAAAAMAGVWLGTLQPDDGAGASEATAAVQTELSDTDEAGSEDALLAIAAGEYADLWEAP